MNASEYLSQDDSAPKGRMLGIQVAEMDGPTVARHLSCSCLCYLPLLALCECTARPKRRGQRAAIADWPRHVARLSRGLGRLGLLGLLRLTVPRPPHQRQDRAGEGGGGHGGGDAAHGRRPWEVPAGASHGLHGGASRLGDGPPGPEVLGQR